MGMFDYIKVECKLPCEVPGLDKAQWQTKDTPAQYLDEYYLTSDDRLEHENYETKVEDNEEAPFGFYVHRLNCHRVFCKDFTGSIRFYDELPAGWYEFCALIKQGHVIEIVTISKGKT